MDVRCDKCATEYELDESQLKPGGVTVKCTTCGHLFRVRGRVNTAVGMGVVAPPDAGDATDTRPRTPSGRVAHEPPGHAVPGAGSAGAGPAVQDAGSEPAQGKERVWLIRLPTGHVETCHELSTLQQWIVSGRVSRNSGISRTGKTWKKLGEIAELASFFRIADEARAARHERSVSMPMPVGPGDGPPTIQPTLQSSGPPPPRPVIQPTARPAGKPAREAAASSGHGHRTPTPVPITSNEATEPMAMTRVPAASPAPVGLDDEPRGGAVGAAAAPLPLPSDHGARAAGRPGSEVAGEGHGAHAGTPAHAGRSPRESNSWADALKNPDSEIQGPRGGLARGVPTTDVAFAKGRIRPMPEAFADEPDPLDDVPERRGGVGKWIVVASLVIMAGAAAALYFLVFRAPSGDADESRNALAENPAMSAVDAGAADAAVAAVARTPGDAGVADTPPLEPTADVQGALDDADASVLLFDRSALEASLARLAALPGADSEPALLSARARVQIALAQHARDQAQLADQPAEAKALSREADERVLAALPWVKKALEHDRKSAAANALMADIVRLQGQPSRTLDTYLREVRKQDKKSREAELVQALYYIDDKRPRKARPMLEALQRGAGAMETSRDVRPTYRLAFMDHASGQHEDARVRVNAILAYAPEHASARALLERIRAATQVDARDPLPPEDRGTGESDSSYESLLARADKKAENGDCNAALALYEQAVDIDPLGVAALTGMGYCYIDRGRYASAHDKFNAALVAAPSYQEALWGIAEAYQQEGKKEQAIKAFQRFLAAHPTGQRADMARRQIERMGGTVDAAGSGGTTTRPPPDTGTARDPNTGTARDPDSGTGTGTGTTTDTGGKPDTNGGTGSGTGPDTGSSGEPPRSGDTPGPSGETRPDQPAAPPETTPPGGDSAGRADDAPG